MFGDERIPHVNSNYSVVLREMSQLIAPWVPELGEWEGKGEEGQKGGRGRAEGERGRGKGGEDEGMQRWEGEGEKEFTQSDVEYIFVLDCRSIVQATESHCRPYLYYANTIICCDLK